MAKKNTTPGDEFYRLWREIKDISRAQALLGWDQETKMPPRGATNRAEVLETLAGLHHTRLTSPEMGATLDQLTDLAPTLDPLTQAQLREGRRSYERAKKVPRDLVQRLTRASSEGLESWKTARTNDDFNAFKPSLENLIALKKEEASCLQEAGQEELYDALLDEYEPGLQATDVATLFDELEEPLTQLVGAITDSGRKVDLTPLQGDLPRAGQEAFCHEVLTAMGFDFSAGRTDLSAHPFCSSNSPGDVRLTWRYQDNDLRPALYGLIHEAGHGLYEQGLDPALDKTPAGSSVSLGVHESQSRLWENLIGRSYPFWEAFGPSLQKHLPGRTGTAHAEALFLAANEVRPSLIRVEADEATYNLHILLRFSLERKLMRNDLSVADLPAAWDEGMEKLLGIRPPSAADGVLQDIHWAMGYLGYFPTYTLGNLYASHLFAAAGEDLGDLDEKIRRRDFAPLREWLGEKIHRHGSILPATRLITEATGKPATAAPLLAHLRQKAKLVYDV